MSSFIAIFALLRWSETEPASLRYACTQYRKRLIVRNWLIIMEAAEKSHDQPFASWRPRKAGSVTSPNLKACESEELMVYVPVQW